VAVSVAETGSPDWRKSFAIGFAEIEDENEAQAAVVQRSLQDLEAFADYALSLIETRHMGRMA